MGFALQWTEKAPEVAGLYWWRAEVEAREEIVEVWNVGPNADGVPTYNWSGGTMLAKPMHEEPEPVDALGGWWLMDKGPILLPSVAQKIEDENAEAEAKPKRVTPARSRKS